MPNFNLIILQFNMCILFYHGRICTLIQLIKHAYSRQQRQTMLNMFKISVEYTYNIFVE